MWKEIEIALGNLKSRSKNKLSFEFQGNLKVIEVEPSCGCSECSWNKAAGILECIYTPVPVPHHMKELGKDYYVVRKTIKVFSENRTDILIFTATITD